VLPAQQYRFLPSLRTLLDGIASLQEKAVVVERRRKAKEGVNEGW
jgi:hypothetical protein